MILCPRGQADSIQAGLLTSGSLAPRAFPSSLLKSDRQWHSAGFVPGYSGGPVFDFHEVPFSTCKEPFCSLKKTKTNLQKTTFQVPELMKLLNTCIHFFCQDQEPMSLFW
jgi:hypothetical protein